MIVPTFNETAWLCSCAVDGHVAAMPNDRARSQMVKLGMGSAALDLARNGAQEIVPGHDANRHMIPYDGDVVDVVAQHLSRQLLYRRMLFARDHLGDMMSFAEVVLASRRTRSIASCESN
jgi:hypothetical protein